MFFTFMESTPLDGRSFRSSYERPQLLRWIAQLPTTTIAMEACSGAHFWGRQFIQLGHQVRLISAQYVKAFVRGQKNDRNDAEAICEAAQPTDNADRRGQVCRSAADTRFFIVSVICLLSREPPA